MILMRVRKHQAENVPALLHEIADVGQDEIDAWQIIARERHSEIDRDPLPPVLVADPVDRQIHADLAYSAERRKDELVVGTRP